jgi:hypothetical protein
MTEVPNTINDVLQWYKAIELIVSSTSNFQYHNLVKVPQKDEKKKNQKIKVNKSTILKTVAGPYQAVR